MAQNAHINIVWDWNGTLLDDVDLCVEIMGDMLARRGLPRLTRARYHDCFDFPVERYYRAVGIDLDREGFEGPAREFIEAYYSRWRECRLHDGAEDALVLLSERGARQFVLSAAPHAWLAEAAEHYGVAVHFQGLRGRADHYASGKADLARQWMGEKNMDPARTLFVGDTAHDADVARAAGARCLLLETGHHPRARLRACGVDTATGLAEVGRFLPFSP